MVSTPPIGMTFINERKKELQGLIGNGTFIPVHKSEIPDGTRIFGSRFIDEVKRSGQGTRKKSRLVAQNYQDNDATKIATKAPTVM